MGKKNFAGGLNSLLQSTTENSSPSLEQSKEEERPSQPSPIKIVTKTSQEGTKPGEIRATFIVKEETLENFRALAFWERKPLKIVAQEALEAYIKARNEECLEKAKEAYKQRPQ